MPIYEYFDEKRGITVELQRRVDERDLVPAGLKRITVPRRLAVFGTSNDLVDPHSAEATVPRGLKDLSNNQVNAMVRESGFSLDKFKRVWGL